MRPSRGSKPGALAAEKVSQFLTWLQERSGLWSAGVLPVDHPHSRCADATAAPGQISRRGRDGNPFGKWGGKAPTGPHAQQRKKSDAPGDHGGACVRACHFNGAHLVGLFRASRRRRRAPLHPGLTTRIPQLFPTPGRGRLHLRRRNSGRTSTGRSRRCNARRVFARYARAVLRCPPGANVIAWV